MTQPPPALATLAEQIGRERDEAQARLSRAVQQRERLRAQAEQLAAYRDEMLIRQGAGVRGIEMLRVQQHFNDKLDQALAYQQAQIDSTTRQAEAAREALLALEIRLAAVERLAQRRAGEAERKTAVQEQKRSDEWAQQQLWQRRESSGAGSGGGPALGFAF
ncbi:MAG: flagellar export protein FliJ [Rubrivivax sp.]|jgi:flagellar export protein FliJ